MENVSTLMSPPFDQPMRFTKLFDKKIQAEIITSINKIRDNAVVVSAQRDRMLWVNQYYFPFEIFDGCARRRCKCYRRKERASAARRFQAGQQVRFTGFSTTFDRIYGIRFHLCSDVKIAEGLL